MNDVNSILKILNSKKELLQNRFYVKKIGIFGSYARKEESTKSDIDILVEFDRPVSLIPFMNLIEYLTDLLGVKVDLVTPNAIRVEMRHNIFEELIYA